MGCRAPHGLAAPLELDSGSLLSRRLKTLPADMKGILCVCVVSSALPHCWTSEGPGLASGHTWGELWAAGTSSPGAALTYPSTSAEQDSLGKSLEPSSPLPTLAWTAIPGPKELQGSLHSCFKSLGLRCSSCPAGHCRR